MLYNNQIIKIKYSSLSYRLYYRKYQFNLDTYSFASSCHNGVFSYFYGFYSTSYLVQVKKITGNRVYLCTSIIPLNKCWTSSFGLQIVLVPFLKCVVFVQLLLFIVFVFSCLQHCANILVSYEIRAIVKQLPNIYQFPLVSLILLCSK